MIGVNSQIFTRSGGSIGLSFAIPVSVVRNVVSQIKENGVVERAGWVSVFRMSIVIWLNPLDWIDLGGLIAQVGRDSPAERAGLQSGDIIVTFDGEPIETSADLPHVVGLIAPGSRVQALIVRDGEEQSVTVEVGALAADQVARVDAGVSADGSLELLGMRVAEAERRAGRSRLSGGVLIDAVEPDSPANEAGVRAGDILTRLGSRPISRVSDVTAAADDLTPGSSVPARLIRGGSPLFIGIRVPDGD